MPEDVPNNGEPLPLGNERLAELLRLSLAHARNLRLGDPYAPLEAAQHIEDQAAVIEAFLIECGGQALVPQQEIAEPGGKAIFMAGQALRHF